MRRKAKSTIAPSALLKETLPHMSVIELLMIGSERVYEIV